MVHFDTTHPSGSTSRTSSAQVLGPADRERAHGPPGRDAEAHRAHARAAEPGDRVRGRRGDGAPRPPGSRFKPQDFGI